MPKRISYMQLKSCDRGAVVKSMFQSRTGFPEQKGAAAEGLYRSLAILVPGRRKTSCGLSPYGWSAVMVTYKLLCEVMMES